MKETYPDKQYVEGSLAKHLFFAEEYKKALEPNLRLGERSYELLDFSSALQFTERAVICAEKTGNKEMLAAAFHQKGMILESMLRFDDALDAFNKSLVIAREIGDHEVEAKILQQMGLVYENTNRFKEATDHYNKSLNIWGEIGDRAGEVRTLSQIGMVYQDTNRFEEALEYYNKSLKIEREIGDRATEAKTLHMIGMVYQDTNRFEEALEYYNKSLKIEREIGDRATEAETLHQIAMVYQDTNRFEEALEYYKKSLEIEREIGNRAGEARTLYQIAIVYQDTNRFDDALECYNKSLEIEREIGDRATEAKTIHRIGMALIRTKHLKRINRFVMPKPEQVPIRRSMEAEELNCRIKELEEYARILKRLRFIRYRYQGFSVETSAHLVGITKSVGYTWQKRWNECGFEGLMPRHGGGRPTNFSEVQKEQLKVLLLQRDHWTTSEVRDLINREFGVEYTPKQIRIILKKMGIGNARSSACSTPESGECGSNQTTNH